MEFTINLWQVLTEELLWRALLFLLGGLGMFGFLKYGPNGKELARLRGEVEELKGQKQTTDTQPEEATPAAVDYLEAGEIVDTYIHYATVDVRDGIRLLIRRDILTRFEQGTGNLIGPGQYNRERLHLWMQSNAARFLVAHRGEMS